MYCVSFVTSFDSFQRLRCIIRGQNAEEDSLLTTTIPRYLECAPAGPSSIKSILMAREVISRRTPVLKPLLEQPLQLELRWNTITGLPSRIILFFFDLYYQLCQIIIIRLFRPVSNLLDLVYLL